MLKTPERLFGTPAHPGCLDAFEPLDACHRDTLRMLDDFERLVARIEAAGIDAAVRTTAAAIDLYFTDELRLHHQEEERTVFPLLASSADPEIAQAVARLTQDHAWLRADWRVLSGLVRAVATGQSWVDVDVLRDGVAVFATLSRDHIALEESLIYPRARIRMLEASRHETRRAMALRP